MNDYYSILDAMQIRELKEAFCFIDQDKDGFISANDLKLVFATLGKVGVNSVITEMLKECKEPIDFNTFLALFAEKYYLIDSESDILNAYSIFDSDETGKIDCEMLKNLMASIGDRYSQEEIEEFFQSAPLDNNGKKFNYEEFLNIIKNK